MKITLCGSARFEKEFKRANKELTLLGHVVHALSVYPSDNETGEKAWYTEAEKHILDLIHLAKILESDAVIVVGDGYMGLSTAREVAWANIKDIPVTGEWMIESYTDFSVAYALRECRLYLADAKRVLERS